MLCGGRFRVRNSGGVGRFRLLEVDDYPFPRSASSLAPVLRSPPFRLSPTSFELAKGQETHLHVDFIPTTTGQPLAQPHTHREGDT